MNTQENCVFTLLFFNEEIEKMKRQNLDSMVEDRIRYTVKYANENSPFYRMWFRKNGINPRDIRTHKDLLKLPIVTGKTIRENQPPMSEDFQFKTIDWSEVFTIHETSGTSGSPKTFFLAIDNISSFSSCTTMWAIKCSLRHQSPTVLTRQHHNFFYKNFFRLWFSWLIDLFFQFNILED